MATKGPFTLSVDDFHADTPSDVVSAVLLLQANGFCVLRETPVEVGARFVLSGAEAGRIGDASAARRMVASTLASRLGMEAVGKAHVDTTTKPAGDAQEFVARLYIARPSKFVGLGEI